MIPRTARFAARSDASVAVVVVVGWPVADAALASAAMHASWR